MTSVADQDLEAALRGVLDEFDCVAGTIHRAEDGTLTLVAHEGMPDEVVDRVETLPFGKGMGGLAAERREPVQVCNLQTDESGVAEDGARASGLEGTIAAPMLGPDGSVKGVIGIGKRGEYEFSADEEEELLRVGRRIADRW
ncbi:GAF domain-containing protein [halophilic archaeon]|nr:GAF domain-containing protein [halophilic archaeon]